MERVSTFGLNQSLLSSAMKIQARLAEKQTQESSGLVTTTYGGLGAKSSTLISLESEMSQLFTWSDTTQTALDRTESMYDAVGNITTLLSSLRSTLSTALSDTSGNTDYNTIAQGVLEDLAAQLNLQVDGRYLFAGGRTTAEPVPADAASYTAPTAPYTTADTSYYSGDHAIASVRVSENQTIDYGVTADSPAFEKAIRAINILANCTTSPMDTTAIQKAYDLATEALDGVIAIQSSLSATAGRMETAISQQEATIGTVEDMVKDIKSVDVTAVAVQVTQYETLLQASYSALGSISGLSLTDYL